MAQKLLILTNIERGEANIFLATARALLRKDPTVELHFSTFPGLEDDVASVSKEVQLDHPDAKRITFHAIRGPSMAEGLFTFAKAAGIVHKYGLPESFTRPLQFRNTQRAIKDAVPIFLPYSTSELSDVVLSILEIVRSVSPDLVVVDSLMTPALTALYHLKVPFTCLSPNSIKEFAVKDQPHAAALWKFPALFTGYSYPVPWYQIPTNVFFLLYTMYHFRLDQYRKDTQRYLLEQHGIKLRTPIDLLIHRPAGLKILVSTLPETDFPLVVPPHVIPCGPIVVRSSTVASQDPELETWLHKSPTIYVNLGSIYRWDQNDALEFAKALRLVLLETPKQEFQVLWKITTFGDYNPFNSGSTVYQTLSEFIKEDRVRLVEWIKPDPISLLMTGQVACFVHHGGANSYNEAILSGVPQVVIPQWTDCYDYAQRVEFLGVGRLGNRNTMPRWIANELASEILHVIHGTQSKQIRTAARRLARVCERNGDGAVKAANEILHQMQHVDTTGN